MKIEEIILRFRRKWMKFRLQPIHVFSFHEIGEFCAGSSDWLPTEFLQSTLTRMQSDGYVFISLQEVYQHIKNDTFRTKKYAALTADDGLNCQLDILPWLEEHQIPITLFLNVTSVEQIECGLPYKKWFKIRAKEEDKDFAKEIYLNEDTITNFDAQYVTIGSHGYKHNESVTEMSQREFEEDVQRCMSKFSQYPTYVSFYAYPYGKRNQMTDTVLKKSDIIPVRIDGQKNYNDSTVIHRESIEKMYRDGRN